VPTPLVPLVPINPVKAKDHAEKVPEPSLVIEFNCNCPLEGL
jgi:hypothetical protein